MVGEEILSNFRFKPRSVVNLFISFYALAFTVSLCGYGSSGIENVAKLFRLSGLIL